MLVHTTQHLENKAVKAGSLQVNTVVSFVLPQTALHSQETAQVLPALSGCLTVWDEVTRSDRLRRNSVDLCAAF